MSEELLYFNGINGATGEYGLPAMTPADLGKFVAGQSVPSNLKELTDRKHQDEDHLAAIEGRDPKLLSDVGWGIIFAKGADPAIKEALSDLLKLRKEQAGDLFQVYDDDNNPYEVRENKVDFLKNRKASTFGRVVPEQMPYYLLIVGSPKHIPYSFQYQLDVQYAVGRIHFETLQEYANYASSVVAAETGKVKLPRQINLFGVANPDDRATELSSQRLIQPVLADLQTNHQDWQISAFMREQATKAQLKDLLGGNQTPALLFAASHGMEFPMEDTRQIPHQGALLCQDWPGPKNHRGPIPQDFYLAGDDITDNANLLGLIAMYFACYGAGTPLMDEFSRQAFKDREQIAPYPFIASLPTKLLGHPKGGALAVVGHIERAWGYSFAWPGVRAQKQTQTFEDSFKRLLDGHPVGSAFEHFNERYAEIATALGHELQELEEVPTYKYDANELAALWTANNDARDYVVLGDPAVRMPVIEAAQPAVERSPIVVKSISGEPVEPTWISPEATLEMLDVEEQALVLAKPDEIDDGDWEKTPRAVQEYIIDLRKKLSPKPVAKPAKADDDDGWR
jgi:hypothetical protein